MNLSHTPWSKPFDFNQSTTSSTVHSEGCVAAFFAGSGVLVPLA